MTASAICLLQEILEHEWLKEKRRTLKIQLIGPLAKIYEARTHKVGDEAPAHGLVKLSEE